MNNMLHFQINPHSGVPVYRQMIDQVNYYVASDALKAGDQLPSIRELAQSLAINPTTVVRVYTELEHEGVIEIELLRLGVRWDVVRVGHFEHAPRLPAFDLRMELLGVEARPREQKWR